MQLPMKFMQALLLGFGIVSGGVFNDFILINSISRTRTSLRSLLNRPPKMYILFSRLAQAWPHLIKNDDPLKLVYCHFKPSIDPFLTRFVKSIEKTSLSGLYLE